MEEAIDEGPISAEGLLAYSRSYQAAAETIYRSKLHLDSPLVMLGPATFLVGHTIELVSKAVILHERSDPAGLKKFGHRVFDLSMEASKILGWDVIFKETTFELQTLPVPAPILEGFSTYEEAAEVWRNFFGHVSNLERVFGEQPYNARYLNCGHVVYPDLAALLLGIRVLMRHAQNKILPADPKRDAGGDARNQSS